MSPQKNQAYFCDGLTEELINRLSRLEGLKVPGRTSTFSIKGKELNVQEIGKKLNVETVLEGSIRKAENKLRITVQLVTAENGVPFWSEKYESEMEDIFTLQDEISLKIVDNLKIRLLREEKAQFVKHDTHNPEAYNLYLKGRFFWNKRTEAQQVLDNLIELSDQSEISLDLVGAANLYFAFGEIDQGFKCLEEAYEERYSGLTRLKVEPLYDSIRSDPRFKALLKKVGLE